MPAAPLKRERHRNPRRGEFAGLGMVLLLAAMLRLWQFGESLWLDELHSAWVVQEGWSTLASRAAMGNQSPPWFVLAWLSTRFGALVPWLPGEFWLRLPSLVAGLALVAGVHFGLRRWTGWAAAGLWGALLIAVDRQSIFYAQEARPYALVQFLALVHFGLLWRIVEGKQGWRAAWIAVGALLFHTHYTAGLLFPAEAAFVLGARSRGQSAYPLGRLAFDMALLGVLCLPAVPHLLEIAGRREQWADFIRRPAPLDLLTLFPLHIYLGIPLVLGCVSAVTGPRRKSSLRNVPGGPWLLTICWGTVPLLLAWSLTYGDLLRVFFIRYLVAIAIVPSLWAVQSSFLLRPGWRTGSLLAVLTAILLQSGYARHWAQDGRLLAERRQGWREAVAYLNGRLEARRPPVFLVSGLVESRRWRPEDPAQRAYLCFPLTSQYPLAVHPDELYPLPARHWLPLAEGVRSLVRDAGVALFVVNSAHPHPEGFADQLAAELSPEGQMWSGTVRSFGNVHVIEVHRTFLPRGAP